MLAAAGAPTVTLAVYAQVGARQTETSSEQIREVLGIDHAAPQTQSSRLSVAATNGRRVESAPRLRTRIRPQKAAH